MKSGYGFDDWRKARFNFFDGFGVEFLIFGFVGSYGYKRHVQPLTSCFFRFLLLSGEAVV